MAVNTMIRNFLRFWSQEHSLSALLVVLIVRLVVLVPITGGGMIVGLIGDLLFSLILIAGIHSMVRRRSVRVFFYVLVVLALITHSVWAFFSISSLVGWNFLFSTLAVMGMLLVTLRMVYQDGPVTAHRIRGAISAYLLLGILFAKAYAFIYHFVPGSINMPPAFAQFVSEGEEAFYYFSIVTLTTVGFGDITAVATTARSLVMTEALIGQLYPAILLARLVSLSVAAKMEK